MAYPVHQEMAGSGAKVGMEYFLKLYPRKTKGARDASQRLRARRRRKKHK